MRSGGDRERLLDDLEAVERIERRAPQNRDQLEADELVQVWILHHLQLIGEACRATSVGFRQRHPAVPWNQIIGMRHILVHDYFRVDLDVVWSVRERDLAPLKHQVLDILNQMPQD